MRVISPLCVNVRHFERIKICHLIKISIGINTLKEIFMHQPFTYLIKHIPSGKVYYGLRYAKNCKPDDLWDSYFTSSSDIKKLIETDGPESFAVEIRKIFTDAQKAIEWEKKVLRRMNAIRRSDFINRNIPGSSMFAHSEETKQKLRKPKPKGFGAHSKGNKYACITKGVPKTKEHAENISKGKKGKAPFKGTGHPRYGTKKSSDEINKMKLTKLSQKRKWMNNGQFSAFIPETNVDNFLKLGYTMGRGSSKFKQIKE